MGTAVGEFVRVYSLMTLQHVGCNKALSTEARMKVTPRLTIGKFIFRSIGYNFTTSIFYFVELSFGYILICLLVHSCTNVTCEHNINFTLVLNKVVNKRLNYLRNY